MSKMENSVKGVLEKGSQIENDPDFQKLKEYYLELKKKGLISPKKYNISRLDTVGRRYYQSIRDQK